MAELLKPKIDQFEAASQSLQALFSETKSLIVRDATIQRFEYTVEAFWKMLKVYLLEVEGIDAASPKSVMREARNAKLFSDADVSLALQMIDDRNVSTHLYNETMAQQVYKTIPQYLEFMQQVRSRFK